MTVSCQKPDECIEIECLYRPVRTPILEGVPGLRTVEDKNFAGGILEVTGSGGYGERPGDTGGLALCHGRGGAPAKEHEGEHDDHGREITGSAGRRSSSLAAPMRSGSFAFSTCRGLCRRQPIALRGYSTL